ncbi:MAG: type III secretion system chaperone [Exilibacterium sp.]
MTRMRVDPERLGAVPCGDEVDSWLLMNFDKREMRITCKNADNEIFEVATKVANLLPRLQSHQLAAALMLNKEPCSLNGGAVSYDIDSDSFLYCKAIDTRPLNLSSFKTQINESFETARTVSDLLLDMQKNIGIGASHVNTHSTLNRYIEGMPS